MLVAHGFIACGAGMLVQVKSLHLKYPMAFIACTQLPAGEIALVCVAP